jgi:hypothetical protein
MTICSWIKQTVACSIKSSRSVLSYRLVRQMHAMEHLLAGLVCPANLRN